MPICSILIAGMPTNEAVATKRHLLIKVEFTNAVNLLPGGFVLALGTFVLSCGVSFATAGSLRTNTSQHVRHINWCARARLLIVTATITKYK